MILIWKSRWTPGSALGFAFSLIYPGQSTVTKGCLALCSCMRWQLKAMLRMIWSFLFSAACGLLPRVVSDVTEALTAIIWESPEKMGKLLIFLGIWMIVLAKLSPALCVFMSHFIICMASPGVGFRGWWFYNLYNPWSVCFCCAPLQLWPFPFLSPLPPEGAVSYGQRLTSFAEASNFCANRYMKKQNGDEEMGKK